MWLFFIQGTGYWEFLLQSRGLDVVAFDQNRIFPPEMRYTEIMDPDSATEHTTYYV